MTTSAAVPVVPRHFAASIAATRAFFDAESPRLAHCCRAMADRFAQDGVLWVAGEGAQVSDAQHVVVEFVHPIIVGKRALPAIALTSDLGAFTAAGGSDGFAAPLQAAARPADMLLALCTGTVPASVRAALEAAASKGCLTILMSSAGSRPAAGVDVAITIAERNPLLVQEIAETAYHVLWELVHVFLDARDTPLAPFPGALSSVPPDEDLLAQVTASTRAKAGEVMALRQALVDRCAHDLLAAADAIAARVRRGGRLLTFGNGGSATDAQDAAIDAMLPPIAGWRPLPAMALTADAGVLTAIANDVGFEQVFARQLAAFAAPDDVALSFSTSGASRNLLAAMAEARRRGLFTIAMTGGDGGALARSPDVNVCITAPAEHLPRIQEAHATAWHALLGAVQEALA